MRINDQEAFKMVVDALIKNGVKDEDAQIIGEITIEADLRGVSSHGIKMVPTYLERIKSGGIDPKAKIKIDHVNENIYRIDGNGTFGQLAAYKAQQIIELGMTSLTPIYVGIYNTNHCGMLAAYTEKICKSGGIGFMTSNTNPNVAPFGGAEKLLGTNPFSVAFPGLDFNIVVDMATAAVAKGKIYEKSLQGQSIPEGWALTSEGFPTTDPEEALSGILLPFGAHKGFGISIIVELLSGVITGSGFLNQVKSLHNDPGLKQNVGLFMAGLPMDSFIEKSIYFKSLSKFITEIKSIKKAKGFDQIFLPGEIEAERKKENLKNGIHVEEDILNLLMKG